MANATQTIREQIKKALNPTKGREASTRGTTLLAAQKYCTTSFKHVNVVHHEITYFFQLFSSEVMFNVSCMFGLSLSPNRLTTSNKYCLRLRLYAYLFKIITITKYMKFKQWRQVSFVERNH